MVVRAGRTDGVIRQWAGGEDAVRGGAARREGGLAIHSGGGGFLPWYYCTILYCAGLYVGWLAGLTRSCVPCWGGRIRAGRRRVALERGAGACGER